MQLIRTVRIERFRSCDSTALSDLTDIVALAGLNNSGKSNILRALNLFFNDQTDPDRFLDFRTDYRLSPPSKKKKMIRVSVQFGIPRRFNFRKGLEPVSALLGPQFWVRKTWTLDAFEPSIEIQTSDTPYRRVVSDELERVLQFLNLISFRYIPNRAVPAEVIREQSRGVIRQLAGRLLTRRGSRVAPVLEDMAAVAKEMVQPIADDLVRVCAGMTDLELSTPASVADLLGQAGFRAALGALGHVEDTALGAGVQSLLMFHVLYMIDQGQFTQSFGWKQASIWAIEEPESSLHRDLQVRLAALLRADTLSDDSRFQILMTTHSDVFIFAGTAGYLVGLDHNLATTAQQKVIPDLAQEAETRQITSLPGAALRFPFDTLVLVEGATDSLILTRAAELAGIGGVRFITPSQLDPRIQSDGIDNIRRFVQSHTKSLSQRLSGHPLLVLVDWEVADNTVSALVARYGSAGPINVRKMDVARTEAAVGPTFRGIERFYPESFIVDADRDGVVSIARKRSGEITVTPAELATAKNPLASRFCATATIGDCVALVPTLEWIDNVRRGRLF